MELQLICYCFFGTKYVNLTFVVYDHTTLMTNYTHKIANILPFILIFVCFMVQPVQTQCFGENCKMDLKDSVGGKYTLSQIVKAIDLEIRRVYWYYLDKAIQIFQSNIEVPNQQIFHFYIYRNRVGTFLAVISRKKDTTEVSVSTFVRLGSGFTGDSASRTEPMSIQPYIISLKLSPYELILDTETQTANSTNQTQIKENEQKKKAELENKINKIDQFLRKSYWYYLDRAYLMSSSPVKTTEKLYVILSYINITGTYSILASIDDKTGNIQANTFVRLGAGTSTHQSKAIVVQPNLIGAQ